MDDLNPSGCPVPERVQSFSRLRFLGFSLLLAGLGVGFWFLIIVLRANSSSGAHGVALMVLGACAVLVVAGIALGFATTRRFNTLHDEVTTRGRKTDAIEWSDARIAVEKGRVAVRVVGNCILCQAPRAADRGLVTQMHSGTAGFGLAGYAASSVRYAREKKKFGWPDGAKALVVNVPLCEDCRVRFPRWTIAALVLGVAASAAILFLVKPGFGASARSLHMAAVFAPATVGAALALAGIIVRDVPVPVRTKRWRERIEVEVPADRSLGFGD
jgi:hypothetical protein